MVTNAECEYLLIKVFIKWRWAKLFHQESVYHIITYQNNQLAYMTDGFFWSEIC